MLYIFQVDTGTMMTFDLNLAMETVDQLQRTIARVTHIPADKQILLISGGQSLDAKARVCSYSAGTDTNPIFLFNQQFIDSTDSPIPTTQHGSGHDTDLKDQVEGSMNMPSTFETVVARVQLALQFHDVSKEELRQCERLVHDQHLQHQGWAAVIANLEDITSLLKAQSGKFQNAFERHQTSIESSLELLKNFSDTIVLLGKTPILACLMEGASIMPPADNSTYSLLDWITEQDRDTNLSLLVEQCQTAIDQFDAMRQQELDKEVVSVLQAVDNPDMKEVKGLEDRLQGLEQLIISAKKIVLEQAAIAQSMVKNQDRARNLRDASVLPDLCNSHERQLTVLLKNQQRLSSIRKRIAVAKDELGCTLLKGLRWVSYVESEMLRVHGNLAICYDHLQKISRQIGVVRKLSDAPSVYVQAVVETVRRRQFRGQFMKWASELVESCQKQYDEEVATREKITEMLRHHFLKILFPGFDNVPPAFATKMPRSFDHHLPTVEIEDINFLKQKIPELSHLLLLPTEVQLQDTRPALSVPLASHVITGREIVIQSAAIEAAGNEVTTLPTTAAGTADNAVEMPVQAVPVALGSLPLQLTEIRLRSDSQSANVARSVAICEGLTDEFVTANFSPFPLQQHTTTSPDEHKLLVDDMQVTHRKLVHVSTALDGMRTSTLNVLQRLRADCTDLRNTLQLERRQWKSLCDTEMTKIGLLSAAVSRAFASRMELELSEMSHQCTVKVDAQQTDMDDVKRLAKNLQDEMTAFRESHQLQLEKLVADYESRLLSEKQRHDVEIQNLRTSLLLENELEIDKLKEELNGQLRMKDDELEKCKGHSASGKTLEKDFESAIEKRCTELQHDKEEAIRIMADDFRKEKQKLANELEQTKSIYTKEREMKESQLQCMSNTNTELQSKIESLEKQVSELFLKHSLLESQQLQRNCDSPRFNVLKEVAISEPTECVGGVMDSTRLGIHRDPSMMSVASDITLARSTSTMSDSVTHLQLAQLQSSVKEKEEELVKLRKQLDDMQLGSSSSGIVMHDKVSVTTCNVGDIILLCLDERRNQYLVFNVTEVLHFLHTDCIETLGLKSAPGEARKSWVLAEVIEKEYCQAKKANNRFGVPVNSKFYRVKAKPWKRSSDGQQKA